MQNKDFNSLSPKEFILIKGAGIHNLKDLDIAIPRNKLVVITGLSGSGKSSLAFDTLYAEGQRRYVESLSSYARQFLGRINKPKVDYIKGIAPAIAIEQKVNTSNPRSTVGTATEIYDYLKLLFARIGKTYSPITNLEVVKNTVTDVVEKVKSFDLESKWYLLAPLTLINDRKWEDYFKVLLQQGFLRVLIDNEVLRLDESENFPKKFKEIFLVIDRIIVKEEEAFYNRLADATQIAFFEGKGFCKLQSIENSKQFFAFSSLFEQDGITFLEPNIHLFSFNNPYGACPVCEGFGNIIGVDPELVIPNTALSIYENAIFPWRGESMSFYNNQLINNSYKFDFPIHKPYFDLTDAQKELIWTGNQYFTGLNDFFKDLEENNYKIQNRVMLSRYRGKTKCHSCKGKRLRKEANFIKIANHTISDLVDLPIVKLRDFFKNIQLNDYEKVVAKRLLVEINNRLEFLAKVGLDYLTLNRNSSTLSGGESQRINLATSLGSSLVGSMYILDEPSIGLHSRDSEKLIEVLRNLNKLGNTVIVVEHDEDIMKAADYIFDIGPEAGRNGGTLVAAGTFEEILKQDSLTAQYLSERQKIEIPKVRRKSKNAITVYGARENNLKNIDVKFPLECLTVVTGVSGSGKSTLVKRILYPAIQKKIIGLSEKPGQFTNLEGNFDVVQNIEFVDQNPIGKSSRSNPVTYIKAYDDIRDLFSKEKISKLRGYQPKHFSFNVEGGRCDNCSGEGVVTIEMQFMADVHLECDVCHGKRFKKEILEVTYQEKNIDDILKFTIDEALDFFETHKLTKIVQKIKPLQDVGLGYVQLGQSSSTLSGGEAQRIKLATFLVKGNTKNKTLFIFDEPTTGLHFHDIKKLLKSFDALIENGHSILLVEHNLDVIKCADYIIDIGPDGGENGGNLIATGTPEEVAKNKNSITGKYLKEKL